MIRAKAKSVCIVVALSALCACSSSGEEDLFRQVQEAQSRALAADVRSDPDGAISAYQSAADAMDAFLNQYPNSANADEVRAMRQRLQRDLRALREELAEFRKVQKGELSLSQPRLPSECEAMVKLWQNFIDRFPSSRLALQARERQERWRVRAQEEINRGFRVSVEEALVRRAKGVTHQLMAGRPWDPELFGQSFAPDPYALVVMDGEVVGYTEVARDTYRAAWKQKSDVLRVSDSQEVEIVIRDRDVAEKAVIALLGTGLFTFSGIQSARTALKEDHDDDIGKWRGSILDLIKQGRSGQLRAGDFERLKVRVERP
jgi:hypothetical protein